MSNESLSQKYQENLKKLKRKYNNLGVLRTYHPWRDMTRNDIIKLESMGRWLISRKLQTNIYRSPDFKVFGFAYYFSMFDVVQCLGWNQRERMNTFIKFLGLKPFELVPLIYILTNGSEYGNKSFKWYKYCYDILNNEKLCHSIYADVQISPKTRKSIPVMPVVKQLFDDMNKSGLFNHVKHHESSLKKRYNMAINTLNEIRNNIKTFDVIISMKIMLRYMDEDKNRHLNWFSYHRLINEFIINMDNDTKNDKKGIYSFGYILWKEIHVDMYKYIYINIYKKEFKRIKSNKNGKTYDGIQYYGTFETNGECMQDINNNLSPQNKTIHTGFTFIIIHEMTSKL